MSRPVERITRSTGTRAVPAVVPILPRARHERLTDAEADRADASHERERERRRTPAPRPASGDGTPHVDVRA